MEKRTVLLRLRMLCILIIISLYIWLIFTSNPGWPVILAFVCGMLYQIILTNKP